MDDLERVAVRVQAIAYPIEARLAHLAIEKLIDLAKRGGVKLRQSHLPRAQSDTGLVRGPPNNVTKLDAAVKRYDEWPVPRLLMFCGRTSAKSCAIRLSVELVARNLNFPANTVRL